MNKQHIAVISVSKDKYSETFIHNQNKYLPACVHHLYGAYLPYYYNHNQSFLPPISNRLLLKYGAAILKRKLINNIAAYCRENKIKALLAHYGPSGVAMTEVSAITNIPLFVYFHGYDLYREAEIKEYMHLYQKMFRQAAGIFAVSKEMVLQLQNCGAPPDKIIYNPCGADLNVFKYADVAANPPHFLMVGRLEPKKNPIALIEAFAIVRKNFPEVRLKIVGTGKLLGEVKEKIRALNLAQSIELVGILSPEAVAAEMRKSRAFVLHSVTAPDGDREGAPVVIMEAGACGLPAIATRHAGIKDIVVENQTGFLVNEHDIIGMANHMVLMTLNRFIARTTGLIAHKHIVENFSLERNVKVLWENIIKFAEI
ncbi:MAG: glycosyltransferase [Bacteroidales bacterium]|nr:glycosyltransferase [Bacteroidales bacterium]